MNSPAPVTALAAVAMCSLVALAWVFRETVDPVVSSCGISVAAVILLAIDYAVGARKARARAVGSLDHRLGEIRAASENVRKFTGVVNAGPHDEVVHIAPKPDKKASG